MMRRPKKRPPALMLTSLLDMFTIILIFLLVSFDAEDYELKLNDDLTLPESSAQSVFKPAVNMAVTQDGVLIEDEQVARFTNGLAAPEHYEQERIPEVVDALERVLAARQAIAEAKGQEAEAGEEEEQLILLQADKDLDYRTLYLTMRSARLAGFSKYRLAILKK